MTTTTRSGALNHMAAKLTIAIVQPIQPVLPPLSNIFHAVKIIRMEMAGARPSMKLLTQDSRRRRCKIIVTPRIMIVGGRIEPNSAINPPGIPPAA